MSRLRDPNLARAARNEYIRKLAASHDYTQMQIAELAGCSQPTVQRVLSTPNSGPEIRAEDRPQEPLNDEGAPLMCVCPITVSFDVAEKMLAEFADIHEEPAINRGVIGVNRRAAELVQEIHPCDGPVTDERGLVRCPLAGLIGDVFTMVAYRSQPTVIPPERVIAAERSRSTGQYL